MQKLTLKWLGKPAVYLDGRAVKLETRKSAALLAYLSLESNRCQREILASLLWPDKSQQKSLANLRRSLCSLNARLPGWIEADREAVRLHRENGLKVDTECFHASLAAIRTHCPGEKSVCNSCLERLNEIEGIYRGDFLEGLNLSDSPEFDQWQLFHREGLRREFAWALELTTDAYTARKQLDQAIDYARRWLVFEPLHEPACRRLMQLYSQVNRRSDALMLFKEFSGLLRQELDQGPEQETIRLFQQLGGSEFGGQSSTDSSTFPLLQTKLYIPGIMSNRVRRDRLVECMKQVEFKALTIVSAPAGFGKTTLLAEWIAQSSLPIAWLSLDSGENDPYRFLSYLIAALESVIEEAGAEARQLMKSTAVIQPRVVLASLLNDVGRFQEPFALVLDDYQFITDPAVHALTTYLLEHIPWNTHIVIASRIDPPFPLGKLRAQDEILELRSRDLRFNYNETEQFLREVMKLDLSRVDVERLEHKTEGWIVGLQMAAIALRNQRNTAEFIDSFSGTNRYVLDYLLDEVLNRQPTEIQRYLLATSILDRLNGSLCEAILEGDWKQTQIHGHDFLEYLETHNLFVIPLDDKRIWFRYHRLFKDLLIARLKHKHPESELAFHRRAAHWFAEHQRPADAVSHALAASDFSSAADLVERLAYSMLSHGELVSLWQWIQSLPIELVKSRPRLIIFSAWIKVRMGNPGNLKKQLQEVEQLLKNTPSLPDIDDLRDYLTLLRSHLANIQDNPDLAIRTALERTGHVNLPDGKVGADNHQIGFQLGYAYYSKGDLETAEQLFRKVSQSIEPADDPYNWVLSSVELAGIQLIRGSIANADRIYQQAVKRVVHELNAPTNIDCILKVCQANILLERNELAEAMCIVEEGIEHAILGCRTNTLAHGYAIQSNIFRAKGDLAHAREAVDRAVLHAEEHHIYPRTAKDVKVCEVNQLLAEGNLIAALQWAQELLPRTDQPLQFNQELEHITLAKVLLVSEHFDQGLALLNRLAVEAENAKRNGRLISIYLLQAIALSELGHLEWAIQALTKSLVIAKPERYLRTFLNEGQRFENIILRGKQGLGWHDTELEFYINRILLGMRECIAV